MTRDKIRSILLAHGFKIPEGCDDLRPYVYEAVEAVLAEAGAPEGWRPTMTELKFDRARFDQGDMPTRTRDGRKVLRVIDGGIDCEYPIVAWIEGNGWPFSYRADGRRYPNRPDDRDLAHEPRVRTVKVAVYRHRSTRGAYAVTSDQYNDFEPLVEQMSEEDSLLHLLEVEVPE